jgi:hypothetical protein
LAVLKTVQNVADAVHARWLTDLIMGAENAIGQTFVTIEKEKAAKMCELAGE